MTNMKYTLGYRERQDGVVRRSILDESGSLVGWVLCTPDGWNGVLQISHKTMNGGIAVLKVVKNSPGIRYSPVQGKRVLEDTLQLAIIELHKSISEFNIDNPPFKKRT